MFLDNFDYRENFQNSSRYVSDINVVSWFHRERENKRILFHRHAFKGNKGGGNPRGRRAEFIIKKPKRRRPLPFHLPFGSPVHQYSSGDAPLRIATMSGSLLYISQHPRHPSSLFFSPCTVIRSLSRLFKGGRASLRK